MTYLYLRCNLGMVHSERMFNQERGNTRRKSIQRDSNRSFSQTSPLRSVPSSPPFLSSHSVSRTDKINCLDLVQDLLEKKGEGGKKNVLELFGRTSLVGPLPSSHSPSPLNEREEEEEEEGVKRGVWLTVGNESVKYNVLDLPHSQDHAAGWLRTMITP